MVRKYLIAAPTFLLICFLTVSSLSSVGSYFPKKISSLERIRQQGKIVVITQNSPSTYYRYRDQPMGFEYDLAAAFARYLNVDLDVVSGGWTEMFMELRKGKGDFIAAGVTIDPFRQGRVDFSDPYLTVRQELILSYDNRKVKSIEDLRGKTIYVQEGSPYQRNLCQLLGQGMDMRLVSVPDVPVDELVRQVAESEIEITVADSNIALLSRMYYPDIRTAFPVSGPQHLGWVVRKGDSGLLKEINMFFKKIRADGTLARIYDHYHNRVNLLERFELKAFHHKVETRLPRYQKVIKEVSKTHGFDWRVIAAMIYQESHFNPRARSFTGVRGIMQVTRRTAEEMGINNRMDPEQSIKAGVGYLATLYDRFKDVSDQDDRLLFAIASYNVGYEHVRDAQTIALQQGLDPSHWASLSQTLPLLRKPKFYRKTRFGFARGTEPVKYVENIMAYYNVLKRKEWETSESVAQLSPGIL